MSSINVEMEKKAILRNINELESAENSKDVEGILGLITEDFILVHRQTKCEGKENVRELLEIYIQNYKQKQQARARNVDCFKAGFGWEKVSSSLYEEQVTMLICKEIHPLLK